MRALDTWHITSYDPKNHQVNYQDLKAFEHNKKLLIVNFRGNPDKVQVRKETIHRLSTQQTSPLIDISLD